MNEMSGDYQDEIGMSIFPEDLVSDRRYLNDVGDGATSAFEADLFRIPLDSEEEEEEEGMNSQLLNDKYWLVKVPRFLLDAWMSNTEHEVPVGTLTLEAPDIKSPKNKTMKLSIPKVQWSNSLPLEYKCTVTNSEVTNELVFMENSTTGESEGLCGSIELESSITPVIGAEYRRIMQDRCQSVYLAKRQIELINENKELGQSMIPRKSDSVDHWFGLFLKKKIQPEKKERVSRADLLNLIFAAFEQYSHWSFKGLAERTKQPQTWLKEVLNDVCTLKKRGPYVGTYELKPEYKFRDSVARDVSNDDMAPESSSSEMESTK